MVSDEVRAEILNRLSGVERDEGVRVLLAVESGSRAWGFPSPNSDYDVRFVYVRPQDWYLSVNMEERPDVLEYAIVDEFDLSGWDVRKALRLLWKSNPAIVEWLQSPYRYLETGDFAAQALALLPKVYSSSSGIYHYRSMAKTNHRAYLRADRVPLKKYFYVLRPLLAVRWLERYGTVAPIEFGKLLHLLEGENQLLEDIEQLLRRKRLALEMGLSDPIPSIDAFIEEELARLEEVTPVKQPRTAQLSELNALFQAMLHEN